MMASLKERLATDLKEAMRARDEVRLRALRAIRAALQEKEIAERQGGTAVLTEEQEVAVLQKQVKQRRDAIEQYTNATRPDLVAKEAEELTVIEAYLPAQIDDAEIERIVREEAGKIGAALPRDMGRLMPVVMGRLRGQAEGKRVQLAVRKVLETPPS